MRQYPDIPTDSDLGLAIKAHNTARTRRTAAEHQELDTLRRILLDAQDEGLSYRQLEHLTGVSRPTLARHALTDLLGHRSPPPTFYDEDEWIATEDAVCDYDPTEMSDRGPYRRETRDDGTHLIQLHLGTASLRTSTDGDTSPEAEQSAYEPLQGITLDEYEYLLENGLDGERAERIVRRLARAVLRVQHPRMVRIGIVLEAAVVGVRADLPGARVLSDQMIPTAGEDEGWVEDLRKRRAQGFYLPKWGNDE